MFSVGLQLFPSGYKEDADGNYQPTWDIKNEGNGKGGPYPFGVDWAWHGASNELLMMNSLKMKLSVLFGVLQMTLGLVLRFMNAVFFKSKIDFFCECIPCLIFMVCFFGWMDFMILYKWTHAMDAPPGIINSLICMAMGPMGVGQADPFPMWEESESSIGMSSVELSTLLMQFAIIAVPWLLLPKPFFLLRGAKKDADKKPEGGKVEPVQGDIETLHDHLDEHDEEHEGAGEIIIHQVIETIEYVLGTVSHTASYLRIWALSLAHQQLSEVFFQKTISMGLSAPFPLNGFAIYIMFTVWFAITFAVLLGMDVLECFLHTLRLHWVEFDSKFFKADGIAFEPYNIKQSLEEASA
jgi:V-type H+-transporting ATPase subunit a